MIGPVWCLGMYGSASTWLFNVVRMLVEAETSRPARVQFVSSPNEFQGFSAGEVDLIKTHEIEGDATILALAKGAARLFITVRDPRDAVTSLIQARSHSFERALHFVEQSARLCRSMAGDKRVRLFRYESGFFDDPATVGQIAAHLGLAVSAELAQAIFAANSRAEVEKHIAQMPQRQGVLRDAVSGDLLDPYTQWHTHHAGRKGGIKRWPGALTRAQIAEIEARVPVFWAD